MRLPLRWSVWKTVAMCTAALLFSIAPARAQWVSQQIKLSPGFTPVYLEVTPADTNPETLFGTIPNVQHVWMYNRYLQTSTFTTDPTQSNVDQDHWLMWYPASSRKGFLSTLAQVRGGQAYLIFLATNAAPVTVSIKGIPAAPRVDWIPFDLVLAGFPVAETGKVTFYQFLKDTPEVSTQPGTASGIYSINPLTARETQIRNPDLTAITPGRAYWTRLGAHSENPFPVRVIASGDNNSAQFPQDSRTTTITIGNSVKTASQTVHLRLLESESPPAGVPAKAGGVPVALLTPQADGSYLPQFLSNGVDVTLAAGEIRQLKLGVAANLFTPTTDTNSTYQALIEVTEAKHGYRLLVPVVAEVPGSGLTAQKASLLGLKKTSSQNIAASAPTVSSEALSAGLWVGSLTLNAVNLPGFAATNSPDPSLFPSLPATPLEVRALIHVDSNGVSRLLEQVFFASVTEGSNNVVRMFSDLKNIPSGSSTKSRISAPSWPAIAPTAMTGNFGDALSATVVETYNDRVNPYVHRYHPDHNNLAEDFQTPLASGEESFDVTRNVRFIFGSTLKNGSKYTPAVPSLQFTGAPGEYLKTSAFTNTPALTVQFWANIPTNFQQGATVLMLTNNTTHTLFQIAFQTNSGILALTVQNAGGTNGTVAMSNSVPIGRWFNFMAAYDGASANLYINGDIAGYGYLPQLQSGLWDAAYVGNVATSGSASFIGEVHDVVVRNDAVSTSMAPQLMATPDIYFANNIQIELLGDATTTNVVNHTSAALTISKSSSNLLNLSSAPSTPLWTFGSAQGYYAETITGLRRQAININGSFQFTRVSQDSLLR